MKEYTMSSDWAAKAKQLDNDLAVLAYSGDPTARLAAIATALREAARVPEGCVRTDDGVDRKVLGTLPVTADGAIVTPGVEVFHTDQDNQFHLSVLPVEEWMDDDDDWKLPDDCLWVGFYNYYEHDTGYSQREVRDLRTCYSTAQAALAARGEGK